ncbi:hypothetical protein HT585_20785 [Ensifer sp. HO-A22]|uniref:Uncharacterized protein n=1 Tax=Ensifer oleiphilus TaxID=2742698 RepID=A0A7Y6Q953_9HYPH|nr:hypothetical protein [Ensifer oleiphilus]NVD41316.1 hypothetical protein [Ensifer oleiphilus]
MSAVQSLPETDELAAALAWHDGDAIATIQTLLNDCRRLREQLALAEISMSLGFTRGWRPSVDESAQPTA